jgi:hypothetical protein
MIGQSPNVRPAPLSAIVRGRVPPAPPSWPLQAGTPLRVSGDTMRCAYGVTRHPPLRALLPL